MRLFIVALLFLEATLTDAMLAVIKGSFTTPVVTGTVLNVAVWQKRDGL